MRRFTIILASIAGFLLIAQSMPSAAPLIVGNPAGQEANPLVQDVRLFCMNGRTGRFLYWGRCRSRYVYRYYRPRYYVYRPRSRWYCRNRYTGRFLHWGRC